MPEITYESIQSMIASSNQEGNTMCVTFKCPVSGTAVEASAPIQKGKGVKSVAKDSVKRSLMWSIRSAVTRTVRSVLGRGIFGRVGADIARSLFSGVEQKARESYSDDEQNGAVLQAFKNVSSQFIWDGKNNRWVAAQGAGDLMTDFTRQLSEAPVEQKYDRGILARMLVEVANADGHLAKEEKEFLEGFITPDLGTVDDLSKKPKLSAAELAETSSGNLRSSMLMLAWTVAFTDEDLADEETARLAEHAQGLDIDETRAEELKRFAQVYVIDQALETGSDRNEVFALAEKIRLEKTEAERTEIRYRKRNGLV